MIDEWDALTDWWLDEVSGDPAYREEVVPLALEVIDLDAGLLVDLGCGDGQVMASVLQNGPRVVGCDVNLALARRAVRFGPVVQARLPDLGWLRDRSLDGAYAVLVLEHLADLDAVFSEVARVVRDGGSFSLVLNHPLYTAPESAPVVDPSDGELFWRWGRYFDQAETREPAGDGRVTFIHRPLAAVLNSAARSGWRLERIEERGIGPATAERDRLLALQGHLPRLLAVRWRRSNRTS